MSASGAAVATRLSVIIPSRQRLDRLPALVAEYLRQGADEVVVVLDGPHPGWADVLGVPDGEAFRVREAPGPVGLARARILGLSDASGDVILAVDDDVEPVEGLVDRHRRFHADGGDRVLQGYAPVVIPEGRTGALTLLYSRDYERQVGAWRRGGSDVLLHSLWGGNLSLPRRLYLRVEERRASIALAYHEDLDLGLRLLEAGATAVFDEGAVGRHHHTRTLDVFRRECVVRGGAIAQLAERWGALPAQLEAVVTVPPDYHPALAWFQRRIVEADGAERAAVLLYRAAGTVGLVAVQVRIARLLRRALVQRGYRRARASG